jgi:hypothetical protein
MLTGEHFAGAPEAALHFVSNKKDSVLAADVDQNPEELGWRIYETAFSEDGLSNHSSYIFRGDHALEGVLEMARAKNVARGIFQ